MKTRTAAVPAKIVAVRRALDRLDGNPQPRYARLRAALLSTIMAGCWKAGDRLPTESELAVTMALSLGTVQRAMAALVNDGVVTRQQGSGSFVSRLRHPIDDIVHCRFLAEDGKSFLPVYSQVLSRRLCRSTGPWSAHFSGGAATVMRIERILDVNGEFDVYSRFLFDARRFSNLASRPLTELADANFKELLREEFGAPVTRVDQSLQLTAAAPRVAGHIGIAPGDTAAVLEIVGRAGGGDAAYFQQLFVPPSPRRLVVLSASQVQILPRDRGEGRGSELAQKLSIVNRRRALASSIERSTTRSRRG